jgi:hypothetical protein
MLASVAVCFDDDPCWCVADTEIEDFARRAEVV